MRPGASASSVRNVSTTCSGAWFGTMMPPAPRRIRERDRGGVRDQDLGRRGRDVRHVVVLGEPVARVAERVGEAGERDRVADRLRRRDVRADGREIEHRERRIHPGTVARRSRWASHSATGMKQHDEPGGREVGQARAAGEQRGADERAEHAAGVAAQLHDADAGAAAIERHELAEQDEQRRAEARGAEADQREPDPEAAERRGEADRHEPGDEQQHRRGADARVRLCRDRRGGRRTA